MLYPEKSEEYSILEEMAIQKVKLPDSNCISLKIFETTHYEYECILLNTDNPYAQLFLRLVIAKLRGDSGLEEGDIKHLISWFIDAIRYMITEDLERMNEAFEWLRSVPELKPELLPPNQKMNRDMFRLNRKRAHKGRSAI